MEAKTPAISLGTWDLRIEGHNLDAQRLGQALGDRATLLVFLRHFG